MLTTSALVVAKDVYAVTTDINVATTDADVVITHRPLSPVDPASIDVMLFEYDLAEDEMTYGQFAGVQVNRVGVDSVTVLLAQWDKQ